MCRVGFWHVACPGRVEPCYVIHWVCLVPCWVVSRSLFGPCRAVSCYPVGLPCAALGWALAGCLSGRVEPCYVRHWAFLVPCWIVSCGLFGSCRAVSCYPLGLPCAVLGWGWAGCLSGRVEPCCVRPWAFLVACWVVLCSFFGPCRAVSRYLLGLSLCRVGFWLICFNYHTNNGQCCSSDKLLHQRWPLPQ